MGTGEKKENPTTKGETEWGAENPVSRLKKSHGLQKKPKIPTVTKRDIGWEMKTLSLEGGGRGV